MYSPEVIAPAAGTLSGRGTAAQSGFADIGLYGGTAATFTSADIAFGHAPAAIPTSDSAAIPDAAMAAGQMANADTMMLSPLIGGTSLFHSPDVSTASVPDGTLAIPASIVVTSAHNQPAPITPAQPTSAPTGEGAHGSGTAPAQPEQAEAEHPAHNSAPHGSSTAPDLLTHDNVDTSLNDTIDAIRTSAASLSTALAALTERVGAHLPTDAGSTLIEGLQDQTDAALADAHQMIGEITGQVSAVETALVDSATHALGDITQTAGALTQDLGADVSHVLDGAQGAVGSIADTTTSLVDNVATALPAVVEETGGAVHDIVADVAAAPSGLASTLADAGDAAGSLVDDTLSTSSDTLASLASSGSSDASDHTALGGIDPAGGITTLVGLVSAADMFDVHDQGSDADVGLAPATGALGAVDLLADISPSEVLLGVDDHHDGASGLLSGLDDHHGHGLGLG